MGDGSGGLDCPVILAGQDRQQAGCHTRSKCTRHR
jgi:hypothetical protein